MANRKIAPEIQTMFDKYTKNFVRRLKRHDATKLLEDEFNLTQEEADVMFDVFDKDKNNEFSLWEFQQFYTCMGKDAKDTINLFNSLEKDHSGTIDIVKCFDTMKGLKARDGRHLEENDIEMLIKSTAGPDKTIDLPKFISLMTRVKFFNNKA
ncbi:hypothetical protein LOTGIDRAFT_166349 [Lottia gigantea]|uniref:EF-hand domain-containing protein n=1 Tax=Lottia gigantea TaxID=225164 RepID=V3Z9W2_LOTGI|nr:hypothetical protein LOTGIDRAFT_166349 [Lottia gigantea]ESO87758.1 hypothetical protein LOTGIDRAFT_166349 [Lottia gigantea]